MAKKKEHLIVLRVDSRSGFRVVYSVLLNDVRLHGSVVQTRVKGKEVWRTNFRDESLNHYDPLWLAHKNGRFIKLPDDHPSMKQAVAYRTEMARAAELAAVTAAETSPLPQVA